MFKAQSPKPKVEETISEEISFVDGELLETSTDSETKKEVEIKTENQTDERRFKKQKCRVFRAETQAAEQRNRQEN